VISIEKTTKLAHQVKMVELALLLSKLLLCSLLKQRSLTSGKSLTLIIVNIRIAEDRARLQEIGEAYVQQWTRVMTMMVMLI
jgi:hypothetical protein